jgi:acetylornithine deacetylase/succinyl-diaminopimelate desuccinylase-like protein
MGLPGVSGYGLPYHRRVRVMERLDRLYAIGEGPGANRIGYSAEEDAAHDLARMWLQEAGLAVEVDEAGNLFGHCPVSDTGARRVWTGSHLDTVPEGGKFDGALGVVAAIEAVERVGHGSVVVWRDEERGCAGSRARVESGELPDAFLELHIEQGPRLADVGAPLAIVSSIAGVVRGTIEIDGHAGHAGTTPMDVRDDALVEAAREILRIEETARSIEGAVATVGQVAVEPGAVNVIASRVSLSVDARAPDAERLRQLVAAIGVEPSYEVAPAAMSSELRDVLRAEIESRSLPVIELTSGAGHDAGILAAAGVPSAMLFVRSLNGGISHSPDELSSEEDVELAVDVLAGTLARL